MAFKDLREWLSFLKKENELHEINVEVDWDLEMADIERKVLEEGGPALLFNNIKDYKNTRGRRFHYGSLGTYGRVALMLGLPKDTSIPELMEVIRKRSNNPIKPVEVSTGSVKENVVKGKDINLFEFPIPKSHERDGGRYICTWHGTVVKDPDSGWINVGLYRGMAHEDGRSIGVILIMASHWGSIAAKYKAMGKPMEVAIAIGTEPTLPFVACSPYDREVCEYDIMGGLREEPVQLVRCETVDLLVPADAEIVIEGKLSMDEKDWKMEGPFGEYTGYYGGIRTLRPSIEVTCITHRDDPILQGSVEGPPLDEGSIVESLTISIYALEHLQREVPNVIDVWCPPVNHGNDVFVKIKKLYQGHAKQVAASLWGSSISSWCFKHVWVFDDDIDIRDLEQVLWAFGYRVWDYDEDLSVFRGCHGSPIDPSIPPHLKEHARMGGVGRWNRICIDATKDFRLEPREEWGGERFPPKNRYLPTPERVLKRWKEYGF